MDGQAGKYGCGKGVGVAVGKDASRKAISKQAIALLSTFAWDKIGGGSAC